VKVPSEAAAKLFMTDAEHFKASFGRYRGSKTSGRYVG
jgi:hypothetical protein